MLIKISEILNTGKSINFSLKKSLTKPQFKAVNKLNAKAWLTYATVAAGLVLTTALVSKFNDKYNNAVQ